MKTIVVYNPAAKGDGALNILTQFLENIKKNDSKNFYYVIVSNAQLKKFESNKVKVIVIKTQNHFKKIKWDLLGVKNFLEVNNIKPDYFISFQSMAINLSNKIPQIVYFHQSLPLYKNKWNPFIKEERILFLYKYVFPLFIKLNLKKINYLIVQSEWVKKEFSEKFKFPLEKIKVIRPQVLLPNLEEVKPLENLMLNKFSIFYPAKPLKYKNHKLILKALADIKDLDFKCYFTFSKNEGSKLFETIKMYNLEDKIELIGKLDYQEVLRYYKSSDLILFTSEVESFGLPLLEAKYFNKNIITVDKEYAKDVLRNYKNVDYLNIKCKEKAAVQLKNLIMNKVGETRKFSLETGNSTENNWKKLFDLIS